MNGRGLLTKFDRFLILTLIETIILESDHLTIFGCSFMLWFLQEAMPPMGKGRLSMLIA